MLTLRLALLAACAAFAGTAAALNPDLQTLTTVPRHELPQATVRQALADAVEHARPERFAVSIPLGLELGHGRWDQLDPQTSRWRLRLHSPGAQSMAAHLSPLQVPAGAAFWLYSAHGGHVYGPYAQADVTAAEFWTPVVSGDELVLEVHSPTTAAKDLRLEIAQAFHGYRDIAKAGGPGTAGSCNVDAVCQTATWGNEIRSEAMITIANQYSCSGQLLNNVRQDKARLFLTARHCGIEHESGPASSVNFYFNYQNMVCGQSSASALPDPVVGGAVLLADDLQSDFSLIRANGTLPSNVYFAGWDATGQGPATSGASLHHPNGDDMKISLYDAIQQQSVDIGGTCDVDAWQVHWSSGTTEPGSSGGGLWDGNSHDVIGVLSGGNASCGSPDGNDYFGRLDRAWTASSTDDGQLKHWLDPDGTCIAKIPGLDGATPGSPVTNGPTRCEGQLSTCGASSAFRGGGGGSAGTLVVGMLGGLLLRLRRARHSRRRPDFNDASHQRRA